MMNASLPLSVAYTLHLAVRASEANPDGHPLVLALWRLWCPAAAWWWQAGARPVEEHYRPHPIIRALDDYTRGGTLREHLERYGLGQLLDEVRRYIGEVKTARSRLPHVRAPELLPTFPGGKIPLERRFGVRRELEAIGGEAGLFAYVRTWAFLIGDWRSGLPFGHHVDLQRLAAAFVMVGLSPLRMEVWAWAPRERPNEPYALHLLPGPAVWSAVAGAMQSAGPAPWPNLPQIWVGEADGSIRPARDVPASTGAMATWLVRIGREVSRWKRAPAPLGLLDDARCHGCPFRTVCFDPDGEPAPQLQGAGHAA